MTEATIATIILRYGFQVLVAAIVTVQAVRALLSDLTRRHRSHSSASPVRAAGPSQAA